MSPELIKALEEFDTVQETVAIQVGLASLPNKLSQMVKADRLFGQAIDELSQRIRGGRRFAIIGWC